MGIRLLTGTLAPDRYGELALGMTAVTLSQQLVTGPIAGAALRFFAPALEAKQLSPYLGSLRQLLKRTTLILIAAALAVGSGLVVIGQSRWLGLVLGAVVFATLTGYSSALDGVQNAARQRVIVAWHNGIAPWLRFLLAVLLMKRLGATSSIAMLGYIIAAAGVLASQFWFFRHKIAGMAGPATTEGITAWSERMMSYALPFVGWGLFTWGQLSSDRWALQIFGSTTQVGLYTVLYQLGYYPVSLLSGLMMQLVTPVLFSRAGDGSDPVRIQSARRLNQLLVGGTLALTAIVTLAAFPLSRPLFALLAAPEYQSVAALLPWMVLSGGIFATGQMSSLLLLSDIKASRLLAPKIVTALIGIGLNLLGAYLAGAKGVVFASVAFSTSYLAWISLIAWR